MTLPIEKTVLVIDDEEGVRLYLKTALLDAGFTVETAVDGLDALEKVQADPPDAISLDLVMPKKSGAKFLHELHRNKEWRRIPVVLVTAHAKDDLGREDFEDVMSGRSLIGPASGKTNRNAKQYDPRADAAWLRSRPTTPRARRHSTPIDAPMSAEVCTRPANP